MLRVLSRVLLVLVSALVADVGAQTGANVLVVANEALPASVEIASYYVQRRNVPPEQLLKISTSTADEIPRAQFERDIEAPIAQWLQRRGAQDRILYIVLTKGIPLRIGGTSGRTGTIASVDSELTLLYRRLFGQRTPFGGPLPNPLFLGDRPVTDARRFSHASSDLYLVTRLDGFTADDAKALVDRSTSAVTDGVVLLDQRASLGERPNDWLAEAARKLETQGLRERVVLERTSRTAGPRNDVLGYYSWGSNDPSITERHPGLEFRPGALAAMFVSTDARTFVEPPATWRPGRWEARKNFYAASPQSLTGDLIRAGVTGAAGYVAEPFLDSSVRPDILFPAYFAGFNLAEAFYLAMPALSWQAVVIGDPLCAPFAKTTIPAADLDPPLDQRTELPAFFSARRLSTDASKARREVIELIARAEARLARGDRAGARAALEEAVALDDSQIAAWQILGSLYEEAQQFDRAIAVYRKLVERNPDDSIALNNLAYAVAVRENQPEEALPIAERALLLAPRSGVIADTVGWIKHLLGDDLGALKLLESAAKALPQNADVQLHLAVALANVGRIDDARAALKRAEAIDPGVRQRPEYEQARQRIGR